MFSTADSHKLEILIDLYFLFVIILNGESFTIVRLQE